MKRLFFVLIAVLICSSSFGQRYFNKTESDVRYNKVSDNVSGYAAVHSVIDSLLTGTYVYNGYRYKVQRDSVLIPNWTGLKTGLYAYYKLDETSGAVIDEMSNANPGSNSGAVSNTASGKVNTCYDFDTNSDIIGFTYATLPSSESRTISLWAKFDALGSVVYLAHEYANGETKFSLVLEDNGALSLTVRNTANTAFEYRTDYSTITNTGVWYNIAFTIPAVGEIGKVYVNGQRKTTGTNPTLTGTPRTSDTRWTLFNLRYGAGAPDGKADEVGYWSRALTDAELLNVFTYPYIQW